MATLSQAKSRRMYSWWWDSHISPKNSKWLQDNLTDVDCKVKSMIKLIEEDADSFARRAEMYYKKRPELMKLVEELYRAYRALAERYDHATVVIRQAHRTMSEAFPNQDPSSHFDDLSCESGDDPRMPENDDDTKRNGANTEDSDNAALDQYVLALEKISNLENRLQVAEEDAKKLSEQAEKAEMQIIILNEVQVRNQNLQNEVSKMKEENTSLGELNASSAIAMKKMKEEVEQRNVLQKEIYCLKEELNELNTKHTSILDQINALGMSPESLQKSVKQLQDEILNLKGTCDEARIEKESLLVKLEVLGQLLEKNSVLENSLSNLSAELDASRGKIRDLEESCQSLLQEKSQLLDEKANILIQLQTVNENLEKLTEGNNFLINSLSDANDELQAVKEKLKNIQDSYNVHADQKSHLSSEKDILSRQLETTRVIFVELKKKIAELEAKYLVLEEEKTSADCKIQELQVSLEDEKLEHAIFAQVYETQVGDLCSTIRLVQAECQAREREFKIEQDIGLHKIEDMKRWLEKTEMENQLLVLENMIILTLFRQLQVEAAHLEAVKMSTEKELNNRTEQNLALSLQEMLHKTEVELEMLKEDKEKVTHAMDEVQQKAEIQKLSLQSDKEKLMDEMRIWETQAMSIFGQLQTVTVSQFVYEQKVHELGETCRILEHASNAKDTQVKLLPGKPKSEISEADDPLLTKDIMLDQVSENSSNGVGKREVFKVNDEFVELWETADPDDNSGPSSAHKLKKIVTPTPEKIELSRVPSMRRKKRVPSSDSVTEKEMVVDKLESSTKSMDIHEAYNRKVLKRLNSDVQKLANLHITVQDLKRKLEITEKGKKGKTIDESNTLKEQLDEAEAMVLKLLDQNGKLLKNIEDGFLSSDSKSTMDFESSASFRRKNSLSSDGKSITGFEDSDNIRRKRVSDQARRMSEKIGRLQLEVQKIQYLLLKFDEEQDSRGKLMSESKRRVLLRDYLYGVSRPSQSRRKKVTFCACIRPSTRD